MENEMIDILLVEDNPDDGALTIRSLKRHNLSNRVLHLQDGAEAIEYLFSDQRTTRPKLILLDLKMPKVDGLELLRQIKADEKLRFTPVVILTSSREERDVVESYKLGVNAYIVKPVDFDKFVQAVSDLGLFWVVLNHVPS